MKICICGKGGTGKSTVVVLLADALKRAGKDVIVLDSDESNSSLFCMLGFDKSPRPLMDMVGGKKSIQQKSNLTRRLYDLGVPVIGAIGYHNDIQSACLDGKRIDAQICSVEMKNIISVLLQRGSSSPN